MTASLLLDRTKVAFKSKLDFLLLRSLQSLSSLLKIFKDSPRFEDVYLILSIDAESDIHTYDTSVAGWEQGVPYILDLFSEFGAKGKACWLVEFNIRDGLVFSNPSCNRFVPSYEDLVDEIRRGGYEFGMHPAVYEWENGKWNYQRSFSDASFVQHVIHEGTASIKVVCGRQPLGCRTMNFHFSCGLAQALQAEGYLIDSSTHLGHFASIPTPNAWFAQAIDYRLDETSSVKKTMILEIPTTDHIRAATDGLLSFDVKPLFIKQRVSNNILFLSAFFHNWDAITEKGKTSIKFRDSLQNFLTCAAEHGIKLVKFSEAYRIYQEHEKDNNVRSKVV